MQLIAMHGWAGDPRGWGAFEAAWENRGWSWQCGNRGYGELPAKPVAWQPGPGPRVVIAHSLGPHLLPATLLAQADAVVLLASFGRFVPEGSSGRRLRAAVAAMAQQLSGDRASTMLQAFLEQAAAPQPLSLLPAGISDTPLTAAGRRRLAEDLELLASTSGLPEGFPSGARLLIVEAGADQIVVPEARQLLQQALPSADRLHLAGVGHCLLSPVLVPLVCSWLEGLAWDGLERDGLAGDGQA